MAIQLKGSNISGIIPDTTELKERELGINTADGKLFTSDGVNIIEIDISKTNTGIEKVNSGWRLVNQNTGNPLGFGAIEISPDGGGNYGASGSNSIAIGTKALASTSNSISIGNNTSVVGTNGIGIGFQNSVGFSGSSDTIIIGNNNSSTNTNIANQGVVVYGNGNFVNGLNSVMFGVDNNDTANSDTTSITFGIGLTNSTLKTVIGRYNAPISGRIFELGTGTSGGTQTSVSVDANGVVYADRVSPANITTGGNQALITVGYLGDPATLGVASVNANKGVVVLTTDDIPTANDKLYISQADTTLIGTNQSDISTLQSSKQDTIIYGTAGQILKTNGTADGYEWETNSILNNVDVASTMGTSGQYLQVNGSGTALEFASLNKAVIGLDAVENMSPAMLVSNEFLPDGTTSNDVYTEFQNLKIGKLNSAGIPDTDQVGAVPIVLTSDGVSSYTMSWRDFNFIYLNDVTPPVLGTDDGKLLKLADTLTQGQPAVEYVDVQTITDIADPSTATAEDVANKLNELMGILRTTGIIG